MSWTSMSREATTTVSAKTYGRSSPESAVARLLRALAKSISAWRERRSGLDELSRMSGRDLADIGLAAPPTYRACDLLVRDVMLGKGPAP